MLFWLLAIVVTAIACAALYHASRVRPVTSGPAAGTDALTAHYQLQLREIEADTASGRLMPDEAMAAKGELAREMIRQQAEASGGSASAPAGDRWMVPAALVGIVAASFAIYAFVGNPDMPAVPLAGREVPVAEPTIDLDDAVARIEAQLEKTPDDLRGWSVIAPVYMQMGRYNDAVSAYRRINELGDRSADSQTDLAQALALANGGVVPETAMDLLRSAAATDPEHVRSRFFLAAELTQTGDFAAAQPIWRQLLALSVGDEDWLGTARRGLADTEAALNGQAPAANPDTGSGQDTRSGQDMDGQAEMIADMVEGLAARLTAEGGSLDEWTRLVRSYLVLNQTESAQNAYDAAKQAYPDTAQRAELDALAANVGLNQD